MPKKGKITEEKNSKKGNSLHVSIKGSKKKPSGFYGCIGTMINTSSKYPLVTKFGKNGMEISCGGKKVNLDLAPINERGNIESLECRKNGILYINKKAFFDCNTGEYYPDVKDTEEEKESEEDMKKFEKKMEEMAKKLEESARRRRRYQERRRRRGRARGGRIMMRESIGSTSAGSFVNIF